MSLRRVRDEESLRKVSRKIREQAEEQLRKNREQEEKQLPEPALPVPPPGLLPRRSSPHEEIIRSRTEGFRDDIIRKFFAEKSEAEIMMKVDGLTLAERVLEGLVADRAEIPQGKPPRGVAFYNALREMYTLPRDGYDQITDREVLNKMGQRGILFCETRAENVVALRIYDQTTADQLLAWNRLPGIGPAAAIAASLRP
jgi:hypothetical protein